MSSAHMLAVWSKHCIRIDGRLLPEDCIAIVAAGKVHSIKNRERFQLDMNLIQVSARC